MVKHPDLILKGNVITMAIGSPGGGDPDKERENHRRWFNRGSVKGTPKSTQIIDFKGKTIVPGFIDTHTHLLATGRTRPA